VHRAVAAAALAGLAAGLLLRLGSPVAGDAVLAATAAFVLVPLALDVARSLARRDVGVDAIALVAIAGALALRELAAAAVVALMLAGGNALEDSAVGRARRELSSLVERAPRIAHRRRGDELVEVPVDAIAPGDVVVVRAGEIVPVDGTVLDAEAIVDASALTGEPLPVAVPAGEPVRSGTANAGDAFALRADRPAAESAYAAVVRLVEQAETQRAPFVRLADRYALPFLAVTALLAAGAWALSGDPVRALAVFVVATPCPLILAAPVAFLSGVSRAARVGVVVKGGGVIEQLGRARSALLDKTGTVTLGRPELARVEALDGVPADELLRLAASVDQLSAHAHAEAIVHAAQARRLGLALPDAVVESPGAGVSGRVGDRRVVVGSPAWLGQNGVAGPYPDDATALVGVDGALAGLLVLEDRLRPDAPELVRALRAAGVRHVALATGDGPLRAAAVGDALGVDRVYAQQSPEQKLELVRALRAQSALQPVVMVGDGINDAPALALADVGVAIASAGATISSDTADAVVVVDRVACVADAVRIGRRSLGIARQSVLAGIGLSLAAMGCAAAGLLAPVEGALLQEAIDLGVILNALRALYGRLP
jgi:heavy metal translocating P-type ATPase